MLVASGSSPTTLYQDFRSLLKYTGEDEFFHHLIDNPVYPFLDLGNGFYYLQYKSERFHLGFALLCVAAVLLYSLVIYRGFYEIPTFMTIIILLFGIYAIVGTFLTKEVLINRMHGYMLRCKLNQRILTEQKIYNVYIRLEQFIDSNGDFNYYIILAGYMIDEVRLSRFSKSEIAMRSMAKKLARNLGLNYFDIYDYSLEHVIFHTREFSEVPWKDCDIETVYQQPEPLLIEDLDEDFEMEEPESGITTYEEIKDVIQKHKESNKSNEKDK